MRGKHVIPLLRATSDSTFGLTALPLPALLRTPKMKVDVRHVRSSKQICTLDGLEPDATVLQLKNKVRAKLPHLYPDRQQFKISQDKKARPVKDDDTLRSLGIPSGGVIFFKDLGPQVGWSTVFLAEYAGPLFTYLLFYPRPALIYGSASASAGTDIAVHVAMVCWTFHYAKRILETLFVHRFSHATMPLRNLFKNCSYYWGFAAFVSYFINHPLYTPPCYGTAQMYAGLALFLVCEYGNFSIHVALRNLRPPGTKVRNIPMPSSNPMTRLFNVVSCPNYTYEVGAWLAFSLMTQCLPALLFTLAGFLQMAQWARGKHRNYVRDFPSYPCNRTAILPFLF